MSSNDWQSIIFNKKTGGAMILLLILLIALTRCTPFWETTGDTDFVHSLVHIDKDYISIDSSFEPDPEMTAFVNEYAVELNRKMNRRITVSKGVLDRGQPESPLGNLTADIIRNYASRELGHEVDIAVMNRGGLRIPIAEGSVTVGTMYELMPFENYITLLKFNGSQIRRLADEIAKEGGEPVSGLRMRIDGDRATDLLVGDNRIDPTRTYWVATNNWLADGGGPMPTLWEPLERINTETLIRDAFINHLNTLSSIEPHTDGRVRK